MKITFSHVIIIFCLSLTACNSDYRLPTQDIDPAKLLGSWQAHYGKDAIDTITLYADNSFKQTYLNQSQSYLFEITGSEWSLESRSNNLFRIHLLNARYFHAGIEFAENDGRKNLSSPCLTVDNCTWGLEPYLFYDPFVNDFVEMVDKLVLDVVIDSYGNVLLHHMWKSSDQGFPLFGKDREVFTLFNP